MSASSESIVLGGGCFWCLEAAFQLINGVSSVVSGYAGGTVPHPTYADVCSGTTGHAEVVRVTFNTSQITLADILDIFWAIHDPTTPNQQGNDKGTEYRSIILYENELQASVIRKSVEAVAKPWSNPIVTEIKRLDVFYEAEAYHQNYFVSHPEQAYCQIIINPKLMKLRQKFQERLKSPT